MAKISTTVGVFAGILRLTDGKLLLRQRVEKNSIIPGKSFKGNWELPGGGVMDAEKTPYNHLPKELAREVNEEVGVSISISPMAPFYAMLFKGPTGYDLALVTPVTTSSPPTKGETIWVSPDELEELPIVSGRGGRMHCMCLKALSFSPNPSYAEKATIILAEIQKGW